MNGLVLVDSSIWIDHINGVSDGMHDLLMNTRVVMHPLVLGEIAMGSIRNRTQVLDDASDLPHVRQVPHQDVYHMIERFNLSGTGIGFVDAHLLAAVRASGDLRLWARDKRLMKQATRLEIAYEP